MKTKAAKIIKRYRVVLFCLALGSARYVESAAPVKEYGRVFAHFGEERERKGKLDESVSSYQKALRFDPTLAEAYHRLGVVYRLKGDLNKAVAFSEKAVLLAPEFHQAYHDLGQAYRAQGDYASALNAFEKAWALYPILPFEKQYLYDLAIAYRDVGDLVNALDRAKELRKKDAEGADRLMKELDPE